MIHKKAAITFITEFMVSFILGAVIFIVMGIIFSGMLELGNPESKEIENLITQIDDISEGSTVAVSVFGMTPETKFLLITGHSGDVEFGFPEIGGKAIFSPTCAPDSSCACIATFAKKFSDLHADDDGTVRPKTIICKELSQGYKRSIIDFLAIPLTEDLTKDMNSTFVAFQNAEKFTNTSDTMLLTLNEGTSNSLQLYFKRDGDFVVTCIEPFFCDAQLDASESAHPQTFNS